MKQIPLTKGKVAFVSDRDYTWLRQYKWQARRGTNTWYARRGDGKHSYDMHREILGLKRGDGCQVDHRNLNGLDNRRLNLRLSTRRQNGYNRGQQANNTVGFKGVSYRKDRGKYQARIQHHSKAHHLGYFSTAKAAALAYNAAAKRLHKSFAQLNSI